jgi:hypothetical protein
MLKEVKKTTLWMPRLWLPFAYEPWYFCPCVNCCRAPCDKCDGKKVKAELKHGKWYVTAAEC